MSKKTTVEKVRFRSGTTSAACFASTPLGIAHALYQSEEAIKTFWTDSPTSWDKPKAVVAPGGVAIGGRNVLDVDRGSGCRAPLASSRMDPVLSCSSRTEADFECSHWYDAAPLPTRAVWLLFPHFVLFSSSIPGLCGFFRDTISVFPVFLRFSLATLKDPHEDVSICGFIKKGGEPCTSSRHVVRPQDGRRPFIGGSHWKPGYPPAHADGHFACTMEDGADLGFMEKYCAEEPPAGEPATSEQCAFIAPKKPKGVACARHGGEEPNLVQAGPGPCPVRARLLYPAAVRDKSRIRVIRHIRGAQLRIYGLQATCVSHRECCG